MISCDKTILVNQLSKQLVVLRTKANLSQEELAKIIGLSRQTYCKMENGNTKLSWSIYLSLLLYFSSNPETSELLEKLEIHVTDIMDNLNKQIRA